MKYILWTGFVYFVQILGNKNQFLSETMHKKSVKEP